MNISNINESNQIYLSGKSSSIQSSSLSKQKNVESNESLSQTENENAYSVSMYGDSVEISEEALTALSESSDSTELNAISVGGSIGKASSAQAVLKSGPSASYEDEDEEDDDDSSDEDLSSKSEMQLRQMVANGEITQSEMNTELRKRTSDDEE